MWLLQLSLLCAALPAFDAAEPSPAADDAYAYVVSVGEEATKAEIERLEESQPPHDPNWADAKRLAMLTLASGSDSRAEFDEKWRRVLTKRQTVIEELAQARQGNLQSDWRDNRWIKNYLAASDPIARALFLRVFVDQFHVPTTLEPLEEQAYSYLLHYDNEQLIRQHAEWLKGALGKIGWFDISKYGEVASQGAWLLIQHADYDPHWQMAVTPMLKAKVASGDMQPKYYAYLVDRLAVNLGEAQSYGTQGRCVSGAEWQPFSVIDPAALDSRRASVGMEPIAEYKARFRCR